MPTRARKTRSNRTRATETSRTGTKRRAAKKATSARTSSGRTASGRRTGTRGASPRRSHGSSHGTRKWSASVNTESTYPQEGLFKKDAATIARSLASKKVSPKGPSSGMRMLTFYVNRAGKNLSKSRLRVLERAKELLHERMAKRKR
jgi:hypothetical protein